MDGVTTDTDLLRLYTPPICSVRWDIAQCGRLAAQLLMERLGQHDAPLEPLRERHVSVELVLHQSTVEPPRKR